MLFCSPSWLAMRLLFPNQIHLLGVANIAVHQIWFAQSLAKLDNHQVTGLIMQVIAKLVEL